MTGGAAAQSGIDDLDSYASPKAGVSGQFQKISEQNAGKDLLDKQEEYVFELLDRKLLKKSKGYKEGELVDKLLLTWKEIKTGNLVQNSFRLDNPVWNEKSPSFQSPVLTFFDNIGFPIPQDPEAVKRPGFWGPKFIISMKIRARISLRETPGLYKLELATVRKYKK